MPLMLSECMVLWPGWLYLQTGFFAAGPEAHMVMILFPGSSSGDTVPEGLPCAGRRGATD